MSVIDGIKVDVSIVLGSAQLPIRQVLKMSRGAIIPLDCGYDDPTLVYVNNELVAEGQVKVDGDKMALEVTRVVTKSR